jgi:hypothetical protein
VTPAAKGGSTVLYEEHHGRWKDSYRRGRFFSALLGAGFGGPLGLVVIGLAVLACPASMGLMMLRQRGLAQKSGRAAGTAPIMADCCLPGRPQVVAEATSLAALRMQRETLERELAELQTR